jgi:hypothetical protein
LRGGRAGRHDGATRTGVFNPGGDSDDVGRSDTMPNGPDVPHPAEKVMYALPMAPVSWHRRDVDTARSSGSIRRGIGRRSPATPSTPPSPVATCTGGSCARSAGRPATSTPSRFARGSGRSTASGAPPSIPRIPGGFGSGRIRIESSARGVKRAMPPSTGSSSSDGIRGSDGLPGPARGGG